MSRVRRVLAAAFVLALTATSVTAGLELAPAAGGGMDGMACCVRTKGCDPVKVAASSCCDLRPATPPGNAPDPIGAVLTPPQAVLLAAFYAGVPAGTTSGWDAVRLHTPSHSPPHLRHVPLLI